MTKRIKIPADVRILVLHECGYKCSNPICRQVITLDVHHLIQVSDDGGNKPDNLLALCPNCHSMHHAGYIPSESLRAWKLLLLALNEAFDRKSIDILLALKLLKNHYVTGDGVLECAGLVASGFVKVRPGEHGPPSYTISLSDRGEQFVEGWEKGDQVKAIGGNEKQEVREAESRS